jgi:hypothetical protein
LPFLGFGGITVAMMVSGGLSVALPTIAFVSVLCGGGVIWAQRFQDRKDAESQAQVPSDDIVATPAVLTRQAALVTQQGELRISPSGLEFIPRPPSRQASLSVPREQIATVSVAARGVTGRRASLVVEAANDTLLFVTAGRFDRILHGVEAAGLPTTC